jgi:hypothetical protein
MQTSFDEAHPTKIGILTFHRCINYGSFWQTRCLVEGIRNLGGNVQVLDHRSESIARAEWRVALRPTLPTPTRHEDVAAYSAKTRKFERAFCSLPLSEPFDIDEPNSMPRMDTVVVGSDEVWNLRHPWFAGKPAFFGLHLNAIRKITYAASFGNYSCWEGLGSPWTDAIADFDALSVRDENSWWLLKNAGIDSELVLDPTLQFLPALPPKVERHILVYGHNFSPEFARAARAWADRRALPLLSIGYRNDWADESWIDASPADFAESFGGAAAVVTNFFHGCAFSLLNGLPFACEATPYRSIKVRGLLEHLQLLERLVDDPDKLADLLEFPPDLTLLTRLRQSDYLSRALQDRDVDQAA